MAVALAERLSIEDDGMGGEDGDGDEAMEDEPEGVHSIQQEAAMKTRSGAGHRGTKRAASPAGAAAPPKKKRKPKFKAEIASEDEAAAEGGQAGPSSE